MIVPPAGDNDLSYLDISFLTFQATVEVIIICLAGFIAATQGYLNPTAQKFISLLNVNLFTPCLIFSKLAPSLSFKKLIDIFVIPIFFAISTTISLGCSRLVSNFLNLNLAESDYVTAMAVFGNSNSLPVSLTLLLSYTLPDLDWEDLNGEDNADLILSRGILYLLIFQQLGQVLRWSWGYNTLLRKRNHHELTEGHDDYDDEEEEEQLLLPPDETTLLIEHDSSSAKSSNHNNNSAVNSVSSDTEIIHFQELKNLQDKIWLSIRSIFVKIKSLMNPPLYSMLLSVIVASITPLQKLFFVNNGFVQNTISLLIKQMGGVSIPLILIVLGSNLAPSHEIPPASPRYKKLVIGSLISRMILPPIVLLPLIALCVKFLPISVLDDPIFLIVLFILTISPPLIQLSQICQLNEIYQKEMAGVLFWGYVVLTLPTTIIIVVASLEVLKHV